MIADLVSRAGPWSWWVLGVVLLILEIVVPGVFLFWIGLAGIATGLLSLALWGSAIWAWQVQVVTFVVLSFVAVLVGRSLLKRGDTASDEPHLNQRGESLVGRVVTVTEAIENGRGRVKIGDTTWSVSGPDAPAGAKVRIVNASGNELGVVVE
ncbi:membrane protein implicated in regulation of membrane protease activity [Rhizobium aquaticum]|uniref:Membrane protein implicated in regulation of membrane protease activity n=1 Tax=Rhizobium aquaticum TaxID=1549636 RepID=A0ABV2J1I3_9HYPH